MIEGNTDEYRILAPTEEVMASDELTRDDKNWERCGIIRSAFKYERVKELSPDIKSIRRKILITPLSRTGDLPIAERHFVDMEDYKYASGEDKAQVKSLLLTFTDGRYRDIFGRAWSIDLPEESD